MDQAAAGVGAEGRPCGAWGRETDGGAVGSAQGVGRGLRGPGVCCLTQWFIVSQSHRSDDNVAGPQEGHAVPDECHSTHQPPRAAESDDLGLR